MSGFVEPAYYGATASGGVNLAVNNLTVANTLTNTGTTSTGSGGLRLQPINGGTGITVPYTATTTDSWITVGGSQTGTITLPSPGAPGQLLFITTGNVAAGGITLNAGANNLRGNGTSVAAVLGANTSVLLLFGGNNWYVIGQWGTSGFSTSTCTGGLTVSGLDTTNGLLSINGGVALRTNYITPPYTVVASDVWVYVNSGTAGTITLPNTPTIGQSFIITTSLFASAACTVTASASIRFGGNSSTSITLAMGATAQFIYQGTSGVYVAYGDTLMASGTTTANSLNVTNTLTAGTFAPTNLTVSGQLSLTGTADLNKLNASQATTTFQNIIFGRANANVNAGYLQFFYNALNDATNNFVGVGCTSTSGLRVYGSNKVQTANGILLDDGTGNINANNSIVLSNNSSTKGLMSQNAFSVSGGCLFDSANGNVKFNGGTTANTWNVNTSGGTSAFSVANNNSSGSTTVNNGVVATTSLDVSATGGGVNNPVASILATGGTLVFGVNTVSASSGTFNLPNHLNGKGGGIVHIVNISATTQTIHSALTNIFFNSTTAAANITLPATSGLYLLDDGTNWFAH